MILDGYWKQDLRQIKFSLVFWSKMGFGDFAEHQISRNLLYSAAIIRKIAEDEKDAEGVTKSNQMMIPPLPIIKMSVPVRRYQHTNPDMFFMNTRVFLSDYDMEHAESENIRIAQICNQIIHSFAWAVVHQGRRIYGVLFASDREKEKNIFYFTLEDWISTIKAVIDTSAI